MFQALSNKVISGVVYLSMILFSSYEGNIAYFERIETDYFNKNLAIRTSLISAFENDFEEIFKSGQPIDIFFIVDVIADKEELHHNRFKHTVRFDPMQQLYFVLIEEKAKAYHVYKNYDEMINMVSSIEYNCDIGDHSSCEVIMQAYMESIRLNSLEKEFDLMTLWKFKKPKIKQKISNLEHES